MQEELHPQFGDIKIEHDRFGYRVFTFVGGLRQWEDRLGYITSDQTYALSFVKGMELFREDGTGDQYYHKSAESLPEQPALPIPVIQTSPSIPSGHDSEEKVVGVAAHQRGQYSRVITTREVTFQCCRCGATVTQMRYPSPKPMYCGDVCKSEVEKEKTLLRVQRLRERRKKAKESQEV
jgi:hypothetical protein